MESNPDRAPDAIPNRQFPIGDIDLGVVASKQEILEAANEHLPCTEVGQSFFFESARRGRHQLRYWYKQDSGQKQIREVLEAWSSTALSASEKFASSARKSAQDIISSTGFFSVVDVTRKGVLPTVSADFSEDLKEMADFSYEQLAFFTEQSWSIMSESHGNVYSIIKPWTERLAENFIPIDEPDRIATEAACLLPYQMSAASRSLGYMPNWIDRAEIELNNKPTN